MTDIEVYDAAPAGSLVAWANEARAAAAIAQSLCKTSMVPKAYKDKPEEAAAVILMGHELGMSPTAALRSIVSIQGTPALTAMGLRAAAQSQGHEIWIEASSDKKAVAKGRRKGSDVIQTSTWTLERATALGLTGNANWRKMPESMLIARATSEVARMVASDAILGTPYSVEELEDGNPAAVAAPVKVKRAPKAPTPTVEAPSLDPVVADVLRAEGYKIPHSPADGNQGKAERQDEPGPGAITDAQLKMLGALFTERGITDRTARLNYTTNMIGRPITTSKELTKSEASRLIDHMTGDPDD